MGETVGQHSLSFVIFTQVNVVVVNTRFWGEDTFADHIIDRHYLTESK